VTPKVSIIIPVYGAEDYIRQCAVTLFKQSYENIEYVFIDDCSPDDSILVLHEVMAEYPERADSVKIIRHEENQGVGRSRQEGIESASGEYLIHCDPDDWVELSFIEKMVKAALESDAEITICDFMLHLENETRHEHQHPAYDKDEIFKNLNSGKIHGYLWNKLIKKTYWHEAGIRIPEGVDLWEDLSVTVPLLLTATNIVYLNEPLYHYRNFGHVCMTKDLTKIKVLSMITATEYIDNFLWKRNLAAQYKFDIAYMMFRASNCLIGVRSTFDPQLWRHYNKGGLRFVHRFPIPLKYKLQYIMGFTGLDSVLKRFSYSPPNRYELP